MSALSLLACTAALACMCSYQGIWSRRPSLHMHLVSKPRKATVLFLCRDYEKHLYHFCPLCGWGKNAGQGSTTSFHLQPNCMFICATCLQSQAIAHIHEGIIRYPISSLRAKMALSTCVFLRLAFCFSHGLIPLWSVNIKCKVHFCVFCVSAGRWQSNKWMEKWTQSPVWTGGFCKSCNKKLKSNWDG